MLNFHESNIILIMCMFIMYSQQQQKDPAFMATYNSYLSACAKEMGLTEDYINTVWKENHFPNDDKLKCYFKCMGLKLGIITEAGETVADVLKKVQINFNDAATDTEIVEECGNIHGTDLCDTAYRLVGCIKAAELD